MQRVNPLITLPGLLITLVIFVGLGAGLWLHGGEAFSPGELSAVAPRGTRPGGVDSHYAIEQQCEACHRPLQTRQDTLCLDCHVEVAAELAAGETPASGPHSALPQGATCRSCHPDHRGKDFSPALAAVEYYTHMGGSFSLERHRFDFDAAPMPCTACHANQTAGDYVVDIQACQDCHDAADPEFAADHGGRFGEDCLACHDGIDTLAEFDHTKADFPVDGAHTDLDCLECHAIDPAGKLAVEMDSACSACHSEPQKHAGVFPAACADCHTTAGWTPATLNGDLFSHEAVTFSLARHTLLSDGGPFTCLHCHNPVFEMDMLVCVRCHEGTNADFMTAHLNDFGIECLACHDGVDRMHDFSHDRVFLLDGAHAALDCAACHQPDPAVSPVFVGLGRECAACHAEPEIHAGTFGLKCEACHTTTAWQPARLTDHTFPLDHGRTLSECATCHPSTYTTFTCYGCHDHVEAQIIAKHTEEGISGDELTNCIQCHPTGREEEGD